MERTKRFLLLATFLFVGLWIYHLKTGVLSFAAPALSPIMIGCLIILAVGGIYLAVQSFFIRRRVLGKMKSLAAWEQEKKALLESHHGWYVAYQNGKRVALEPSLKKLNVALEQQLAQGTERKQRCVFKIVE